MAVVERDKLVGLGAAALVILLGMWVLGGEIALLSPYVPGDFTGLSQPQLLVAVGFVVVVAYIVGTSESEISFPFLLSLVAILTVVWQYLLPERLAEAFPLDALGVSPSNIDAVPFAFLVFVAIVAYYVVSVRAGSGAKTASTTTKRTIARLEKLAEEWSTITRLAIVGGIGVIATLLAQGGPIAGGIWEQVTQAPVVVANVLAIVAGYLGLSGDLLQDPRAYALVTGVALVVAVGVRYSD